MIKRNTVLDVEELGSRMLPSASPFGLQGLMPQMMQMLQHAQLATLAPHGQHTEHGLHGSAVGTYTHQFSVPDTGASVHLDGAGQFGRIGPATVTGDIHGVGFIQQGHATGTLTLTNARGSVTLQLTGPEQSSFAPLPNKFDFHVISGTGAFQDFHAHGTLQLQLNGNPTSGAFLLQM